MTRSCTRPFDESWITGYLDGELTQAEAQRVRVHLEDCATCRALLDDLTQMREATMTTPFPTPSDDQWDETPRGLVSHLGRNLGWLLLGLSSIGLVGLAAWQILTETSGQLEQLLFLALGAALMGLFLSVLIDRIRARGSDRYRRVKK